MSRLTRICEPLSSPNLRDSQFLTFIVPKVTAVPMTMPPMASHRKVPKALASEKVPVSAAATAKRMQTRPDASLSRDSPSRMCISRLGIGARLAMADTAMGSVGETMAASAKATASGIDGIIQLMNRPTPRTVKTTRPRASLL